VIVGLGVDLVEVARIRRLLDLYGERFLLRVYLPEERAYAMAQADPAPSLAARFAAKEAFVKAYPGVATIAQVGVVGSAPPHLAFRSPLAEDVAARGLTAHLSLSHERTHAVAVVVLETANDPR